MLNQSAVKSARLPSKWRKIAENQCAAQGARLTPARLSAYAELITSKQPLSAYELVALLEKRQDRKIAPLTVYRHLDFLMKVGLVHRLESTQSYVPCATPDRDHNSLYLLCDACGRVDELDYTRFSDLLGTIANENRFELGHAVVELAGRCARCNTVPADGGSSPSPQG